MAPLLSPIHIHVTSRRALDDCLEAAAKKLQDLAVLTGTHGILVARKEPGHYTAELSDQVPFGLTREVIC